MENTAAQTPVQATKKFPLWAKIVLGFVGVIVLIILLAMWATLDIVKVAEQQLDFLKVSNYSAAYDLMSQGYKNGTNLEGFTKYVDQNTILSSNIDHTFSERNIENNIGTIKGTLKAADGKTVVPVVYQFVKENEAWKVLNLSLSGSVTSAATTPAKVLAGVIDHVYIADKATEQGVVEQNQSTYAPDTAEIFVSVYLTGAEAGLEVSSELVYLQNGDKIGPAVNPSVSEGGDLISLFTFSKPTEGWPEGDYKITVRLSNGQTTDVPFSVK